MTKRAIYMSNGCGNDPAIERGLTEAGCEVICTHSITETLGHLNIKGHKMSIEAAGQKNMAASIVLVAEIQAGAIPLLTLLREQGAEVPPTLVFDRDGTDIRVAIKALQLGVRDYLLASDPDVNRELCACVLVEREGQSLLNQTGTMALRLIGAAANAGYTQVSKSQAEFEWDASSHVVRIGTENLRLSPIEGRIFDLLHVNRGQVVTVNDFLTHALKKPTLDALAGARQLRPHLMRLRRKLGRYPLVANRIVNTRGAGYMLV